MITKTINLTPHEVTFVTEDNAEFASFPAAAEPLRLAEEYTDHDSIGMIPVVTVSRSLVANLPPTVAGTIYIVSEIVQRAYPYRGDFYAPARVVRDASGQIIGSRALAQQPG